MIASTNILKTGRDVSVELSCQSVYGDFVHDMAWQEQRRIDGEAWKRKWLENRLAAKQEGLK